MRRESRKTISEKRRKLLEADITIRSNFDGEVILRSEVRGVTKYKIGKYDYITVSFEDAQSIARNHKSLFENFVIFIEDVYCPDAPEITPEEVEEVLGLNNLMKGLDEMPDDLLFDKILKDDTFEDFRKQVESFKRPIVERLAERAIYLYKNKEFADSFKMSLLEDKLGVRYVFEDARRSQKEFKGDVDIF